MLDSTASAEGGRSHRDAWAYALASSANALRDLHTAIAIALDVVEAQRRRHRLLARE